MTLLVVCRHFDESGVQHSTVDTISDEEKSLCFHAHTNPNPAILPCLRSMNADAFIMIF